MDDIFEKAKLCLREHLLNNKEQVKKDLHEMCELSNSQKTKNLENMLNVKDVIEFESGLRYEIIKCHGDEIYDIKSVQPQCENVPDYFPVFCYVKLECYKIIK